MDVRPFTFQLKLDRGALLRTLWHHSCLRKLGFPSYLAKKTRNGCWKIVLRAFYSIYLERNIGELVVLSAGIFFRLLEFHCVKESFGSLFFPLSFSLSLFLPPIYLSFFFSKMPRLELTFSKSKFAACQFCTFRVFRAFRIPDIDSRAKCLWSIKLSLIPNPTHRERLAL